MNFYKQSPSSKTVLLYICLSLFVSCQEESNKAIGSLDVLFETEDLIIEGLTPGEDTENIHDGWAVSFDKYITTIGPVDLHLSTDEDQVVERDESYVIDMLKLPSGGVKLWSFDELQAGRWELFYATLGAGDGATRHDSVDQDDFDLMVNHDWTYLVHGTLSSESGQSCPPSTLAVTDMRPPNAHMSGENFCYDAPEIRFEFGAKAETRFGPCEIDGLSGVSIPAGGTQSTSLTIHGDHLFFNGFPEGDEGGVMRLAQWLADCDLNLDGLVTQEELESIAPSQLVELDERFQLGGSPITPLKNMYEYVIAQLKTQGHYQGEGECPLDGVAHDHANE